MDKTDIIPIFIGYDFRERAATNVLIDSLYQRSSKPLSITPLVIDQLKNNKIYWRKRDKLQSTDFSFSRFLIPFLMNYQNWAIFMDCDMLCLNDISKLWSLRDEKYALMCVKHDHKPKESIKFLGEIQSEYPKKNWSSLMLFNCKKCRALTVEYVNNASGMDLHRFNWLKEESLIGGINSSWNKLVDVEEIDESNFKAIDMLHWTLGGPWFNDDTQKQGSLAQDWFAAREEAMKLWKSD